MFVFPVFISKWMHACSKQVHKCKLHTDILKIPSGSGRWAPKFISSDWLKFSELHWKNRNLLFHEIMLPNNCSLLSEQFSLSHQVTAESCCFSFFICISQVKNLPAYLCPRTCAYCFLRQHSISVSIDLYCRHKHSQSKELIKDEYGGGTGSVALDF